MSAQRRLTYRENLSLLPILFFIIFILSPSIGAEGNTYEAPYSIVVGTTSTGQIYEENTEDWWQVEIREQGLLEATLHIADSEGRARLRLYHVDSPTSPRESIYVEAGADGAISYPVGPGVYLLRVTQNREYFSYELKAELKEALLPPDPLDNHSFEDAVSMELGQEVTGNLGYYLYDVGYENEDWWQVEVEEYGELHIALHIPDSEGRARLRLYHVDSPTASRESIYVEAGVDGAISYPVGPGVYLLRVTQNQEYFSYQLKTDLKEALLPPDPLDNHSFEDAVSMELGQEVTGNLGYYLYDVGYENEDWWEVEVEEYGELHIALHIPDSIGRARLRFYAAENPGANRGSIYVEAGEEGSIRYPIGPGTYVVRVTQNQEYFSYQLKTELKKALLPPDPIDNHSYENAIPVKLHEDVTGVLGYYTYELGYENEDWWQVEVKEHGLLEASVSIPDSIGRLRLRLYHIDSPGSNRGSIYVEANNEGSISFNASPGIYFLRVEQNQSYFSYQLHVNHRPSLLPPKPKNPKDRDQTEEMGLGSAVAGVLGYYQEDDDWWEIHAPEGGELTLNVYIPHDKGRLRLRLYPWDSGSSMGSFYIDSREASSMTTTIDPGTYHVRAERNRDFFSYLLTSSLTKEEDGFQVVNIYPRDGKTHVPITTVIGVTFNQALQPSSVHSSSLQVFDDRGRQIQGDIDISGTLAVFRPLEDFDPNMTYRITVGRDILDERGNSLGDERAVVFSTEEEVVPEERKDPIHSPFDSREYEAALERLESLLQWFKESGIIHQEVLEEIESIINKLQGAVY